MKIVIIDPSSTEFNRGSFCYAPYLLYNGLAEEHDVELMEAFRSEDGLDKIDLTVDMYIVTLWSYPQIEACLLLHQMLPMATGKDNVYFAGYNPLIQYTGFQHVAKVLGFDPLSDASFLKRAMFAYPFNYVFFDRLLLSDCDMHLKHIDKGETVYPLFTSYGCPNGCTFCPSSTNCGRKRVALKTEDVLTMLYKLQANNRMNIHFTDEDFFFSSTRAADILEYMAKYDFHAIALASSESLLKFADRHGIDLIIESGLEVIEVGFESADEELAGEMGAAKSLNNCYKLADSQKYWREKNINIFWLVQTFFPGETIQSLARTGQFMRAYGHEMDEVVGRLRTNGTKGGLGQFFQPYHGTPIYDSLGKKGIFLTLRPIRLIPSYLPLSFLNSKINYIDMSKIKEARPWLDLYNIKPRFGEALLPNSIVMDYINNNTAVTATHNAIGIAILARMGVIT